MSVTSVQELRRIAEAVGQLRGRQVFDVEIRSDCRRLRITLDNGELLLVSVILDDAGRPRLDVDFLRLDEAVSPGQLEVHFEGEAPVVERG